MAALRPKIVKLAKIIGGVSGMTVRIDENTPEYYTMAGFVTDDQADIAIAAGLRTERTAEYLARKVGKTVEEIMPEGDVSAKWAAFGWNVIPCDGHDLASIEAAISEAKACSGQPSIIIAETVKGKGVTFMEGKSAWHGKAISDADYAEAKKILEG